MSKLSAAAQAVDKQLSNTMSLSSEEEREYFQAMLNRWQFLLDKKERECTDETRLKTYFFSFGHGQEFPNGYMKIKAKDSEAARATMIRRFGTVWAFQYDEEDEASLINSGMHRIS